MYQNRTKPGSSGERLGGDEGQRELQLVFLGTHQVRRDGVPVTGLAYKKSLALLCYLAVTGRTHSREKLAGLLWGELDELNARANLRKVLADLGRCVGQHLIITRHTATLNRERPYWLDVKAFECRVSQALGEQHTPLTDEGVVALKEAVELYQGDFLDGFYVHRALAFEEWTLLQQARLKLSALRALHALGAHYAAQGAHAQAIAYTARLLELEPLQEEGHRQMMTLLARSGQKGAAVRQYEVCRRAMAQELDVEPSAETTALYERIRSGAAHDALVPAVPNNLPVPFMPLVGREAELAEITRHLQDPACRLLTLVGPGGSGKTRLAQEAAAAQLDRFEHGVYWVSLASLQSIEAILPAIAQALHLPRSEQGGDPDQQLLDYLREKSVLLILDSFEHLLGGAGRVMDILKTAPRVKMLITSRFRLNMRNAYLLPIAGLDCPASPRLAATEPILGAPSELLQPVRSAPMASARLQDVAPAAEDAAQSSGVKLFLHGVGRVRPGFKATADELLDVVCICRLLQGMPLALLLAAGWAKILTPAKILAHLSGDDGASLDFLAADWPDVPPRQRSIRAVFDRSWNLLSEREREVFSALSVFRGGFTQRAAQQVSSASLRELMALVDKSLLQWTPEGEYEIHELLRRYAAEKLEQAPAAGAEAHLRQRLMKFTPA